MQTTSKIPIPDFFIALVLPDNVNGDTFREPTADETEELRQQTVKFWTQLLDKVYNQPDNNDDGAKARKAAVSFDSLDLTVRKTVFGERPEEVQQDDLEDKFNAYIELGGTATFSSSRSKAKSLPDGNQVFRKMVAGDSMDYLCRFVKTEGETTTDDPSSNSAYSTAIEVCAKRLTDDPDNHVFVVRSPNFFIALATDPFDDEEDRAPTETETVDFTNRTRERILHHLSEDYPDTLIDCNLDLVRSESGTSKPDDRFNLYFEHEATATFSADPPSQEELFALIMKCANSGFTGYVTSLREMDGTPFVAVTVMTINIVGLEMPQTRKLEELPPPPAETENKKEEEEEEEEEEQGSGDESDDDDRKKKKAEPQPKPQHPPPKPKNEIVTRHVPIFLALVVSAEAPAALPKPSELADFKDLILRYFYTILKNDYPESLIDMTLKEEETKFDAGIPERRFNMCVEYEAAIRFEKENAPEEKAIKKLIIKCNVGTILAHVKKLDPLCFEKTTEVSMRRKPKKRAPEKKKIKDSAFEAAIELLEPPPVEEKVPVEKEEDKEPPEATPADDPPKVEPDKEIDEEPEVVEEKEEEAASLPKIAEKEKEKTTAPTPTPAIKKDALKKKKKKAKKEKKMPKERKVRSRSPSPHTEDANGSGISRPMHSEDRSPHTVNTAEVYIAFKLNYIKTEPTEEEYEKMRKSTQDFFQKKLKKAFPKLDELQLRIRHKEYGTERPDKNFNVYVEWDIAASFQSDESEDRKTVTGERKIGEGEDGDVPAPDRITKVIVRDINLIDYLMKAVQPIKNTAFANVSMGMIGERTKTETRF